MKYAPADFLRAATERQRWGRSALLSALLSLLSAACAHVPAGEPPAPPLPERWSIELPVAPGVLSPWWRNFQDPGLDRLIARGLEANADLQVAALQWKRADLLGRIAGNNQTPSLGVSASLAASHAAGSSSTISQGAAATATVSYTLDLWGRLSVQRAQAAWESVAAREDCESAAALLEGSIASAYWEIAYQRRLLANADAGLAYSERTLGIVGARYREGAVSGADVAQAQQRLAARRALRSGVEQRLVELRQALGILLDRPAADTVQELSDLPDALIPPVDAGWPAQLLDRRPDLRAARMRLHASGLQTEAVRLSFYPDLSLTGALGVASDHLLQVLAQPVSALAIGLSLPLLQPGTPDLAVAVARTEQEAALAAFRGKLFAALGEVEVRLSARAQLQREAAFLEESLKQARVAETQAEARYRAGATAAQLWLDTQDTLRGAEDLLAGNHFKQLSNMVGLYLALGGDARSTAPACRAPGAQLAGARH